MQSATDASVEGSRNPLNAARLDSGFWRITLTENGLLRTVMIPPRIVGALAIAAVLATSPASAQNDLRPDAKQLTQSDAWCPIVLNHHLPALTGAFVEFVKRDLSKRGDLAIYEAIAPLLETLASVGRMDDKNPVRQAHLAMACTLGLPVVKKMIARDFR